MNYSQLYKHKNLYRIYCDKEGTWHVVSYPIIYMNQKRVYCKCAGNDYLDCVSLPVLEYNDETKQKIENRFYDGLDRYIKAKETSWYFNAGYFLEIDVDDAKEFCAKLSKICHSPEYVRKLWISQLEGKLAALETYVLKYDETKAELDKLKSEETT